MCVCCCFFFGKAKRRTSLKAVSAIECVCWMGYFFGKWLVYNIDFMLSHSCIHLYMHFQCVSPLHSLFLLSHCLFFTFCRFCLSFSRPLSFAWRLSYSKYELWTHFFGCFFFWLNFEHIIRCSCIFDSNGISTQKEGKWDENNKWNDKQENRSGGKIRWEMNNNT